MGWAFSLTSYMVGGESLTFSDPQVFLLEMGANMRTSGLMCVKFRPGWADKGHIQGRQLLSDMTFF